MKYYICSDLHFNHAKMVEYCGRPPDFEEQILRGLQSVPEDATLICLGDVCIGRDAEMHEKYIQPLKCRKVLVKGNHDKKSNVWYLNHGWNEVTMTVVFTLHDGKRVLLTHAPSNALENISFNIHGHFHNKPNIATTADIVERDAPYRKILGPKHKLFALEIHGYVPIEIEEFLKMK